MIKKIPSDILKLIIDMVSLKDFLNFLCLNKDNNEFKKIYNYPYMIYIPGSIKNFIKSFPNFKFIDIHKRSGLLDDDFQLCNHIQKINMKSCDMSLITDNIFSHLTNLKELNLLECWKTNTYSDKIFDYLSNLEKFSINYNYVITDQGLQKLLNLKDLHIEDCFHISGDSLSYLTNLTKLDIYRIKNLFDHNFKNLINLEELTITFIHNITSDSIARLSKLRKLICVDCKGITSCVNFDKLLKLNDVSFFHCPVIDTDFIYLKYIKRLSIINCPLIHGNGFKYLKNIEVLSIYENVITDSSLDDIIMFKNIKKLTICNYGSTSTLSIDREKQLKEILGDKFNTN